MSQIVQHWNDYFRWQSAALRRPEFIARIVMRDATERFLIGGRLTKEAANAEKFESYAAARAAVREFTRDLPLWAYAADIFDVDCEEPVREDEL